MYLNREEFKEVWILNTNQPPTLLWAVRTA